MAESSALTPVGWSRSDTDIDLEDMPTRIPTVRDGKRQPLRQKQKMARRLTGSARVMFRRDPNDEIFEMISGDESLVKDYRKIARRSNLGRAEQIFMYKTTDADDSVFEKHDTWSACFKQLCSSTGRDRDILEICLITSDTTNLGRVFSFIHRLFLLDHQRLQQAYSVPSQIVTRILQRQWRLGDETMTEITESLCAKELSLPGWQPKLPSHCNKADIEGHLQVPLKFAFKWINAPYYTTDLSVYVFRPYGKHPQVKTLDVILTSREYEQVRQVIVVVNSHNTLADLRCDLFPRVFQQDVVGLPYIMRLFRVVCAKITDELVTFMTKACDDINYMSYEGRLRPSGSKMQYLRHLEDCHRAAQDCCQQNRSTLQSLLDEVDLIQRPRTEDETRLLNELKMTTNDLDYLSEEVNLSLQRIPVVCRDIREQLDFLQIRRTSILGILAGLYLPLAFVSSFLGMNINQYTQIQPSWRNITHTDPTHPDKHTISHSEIVDSGANQSWSLANFFEIAVPLMFGTILIPLVIGSIIRVFLQALGRGRTWWRLLFPIFVVGYCIVSAILTLGGIGLGMFIPFDLLILLNLFSVLNSFMSSRGKKEWGRLAYWFVNMGYLLSLSAFVGDEISLGVMGAVYGISLFVVWWLRPDFYYRWDQGRRPRAKG